MLTIQMKIVDHSLEEGVRNSILITLQADRTLDFLLSSVKFSEYVAKYKHGMLYQIFIW